MAHTNRESRLSKMWAERLLRQTDGTLGTILSLGMNKLVLQGAGWLQANGLLRYVLPLLLANEAFGAWRAYEAGAAIGWW